MIGTAAMSIVNVAKGVADAYFEKNIMIWDVAAGLAIIEGAGGSYSLKNTQIENSLDITASNKQLLDKINGIINER